MGCKIIYVFTAQPFALKNPAKAPAAYATKHIFSNTLKTLKSLTTETNTLDTNQTVQYHNKNYNG